MTFLEALDAIKKGLKQPGVQWALWTFGSILMIFTPDHIDRIIEGILALLGVKALYEAGENSSHKDDD